LSDNGTPSNIVVTDSKKKRDWSDVVLGRIVGSAPELWTVSERPMTTMVLRSAGLKRPPVEQQSCDHHEVTPLELAGRFLAKAYEAMVTSNTWDTRFHRGRRQGDLLCDEDDETTVRSLATDYLARATTDSWSVLSGAIELARIWGLRYHVVQESYTATDDLGEPTRMRLATCLHVSWKFARSLCSHMHRGFAPGPTSEARNAKTLELAFVGYVCLRNHEQDEMGPWHPRNTTQLRILQRRMQALETALVCGDVAVFPALNQNALVMAEWKIHDLFLMQVVTARRCMELRSLLPFFVSASLFKRQTEAVSIYQEFFSMPESRHSTGIVCAAWMCIRFCVSKECSSHRGLFLALDLLTAWRLLDVASRACAVDPAFFRRGCFGDASWFGYVYLTRSTLLGAMNECTKALATPAPPGLIGCQTC
jgi:hypothetical protein